MKKTHLEITLNNTQNTNDVLNSPITFVEVRRSILLSKKNKTPGVDLIPNEVIKNPKICKALFTLFNFCFQNHIVPNLWLKSIVKPIPKNPEKSPYVPMNYCGISLISCIAKLYSSILNSRVSAYLEDSKILVEEQNGFRKGRSCEDHIFVLSSLIKSKKKQKIKVFFAAFIDMSKAFDCINRDFFCFINC